MSDSASARTALLAAGVATFVMMGVGQSLYGPALPVFARLFDVSAARTGLLVSAHWTGCAIGIAIMFAIGDRIAPRLALAIMALGALGISALAGWWVTLLSAGVFGVGYSMATALFNPRVLLAFGAQGPSMLSLLNACFGIGAILAPLAFVWTGSDPRIGYLATAALAAAIWLMPGAAAKATAGGGVARGRLRLSPPILGLGAVAIGIEAALGGLGPTALIAAGVTEARAATLLSAFYVVFLASRIVLSFAANRIDASLLLALSLAATAALALGGALGAPALCFVAMGAPTGAYFPTFFVAAARRMGADPRVPPAIIGAGLAGGILAPLVLAQVMGGLGAHGFFWLTAGLAGLASLAALVALRRGWI